MRAGYLLRLFVLVSVLVGIFSHICALPLDAHAMGTETHEHDEDAVHAASCEAVMSTPPLVVRDHIVVAAILGAAPQLRSVVDHMRVVVTRPVVRGSPPLYLRYSVLLI